MLISPFCKAEILYPFRAIHHTERRRDGKNYNAKIKDNEIVT